VIGSCVFLTNLPAPRPTVKKFENRSAFGEVNGQAYWTDKGQWYDGFMSPCTFVRNRPDVQDELIETCITVGLIVLRCSRNSRRVVVLDCMCIVYASGCIQVV